MTTNADGSFHIPALHFFDSAKLSMYAVSAKRNKPGVAMLDSTEIAPRVDPFTSLNIAIRKKEYPFHSVELDTSMSLSTLEDITIKGTSMSTVVGSAVHFQSDLVVSGEALRAVDNGDLLSLLQSKIAGLRVLAYLDQGLVKKVFKLGGPISFGSNPIAQEPIVMVDGSMIYPTTDESAAEQVSRLNTSTIDRVEVIKFGGGAAYGARGANGVLAIYTNGLKPFKTNTASYEDKKFQPITTRGYARFHPFTPKKLTRQDPANSTTLFWDPMVVLDGKQHARISFTAPDNPGDYLIVVEGVTAERAVRGAKIFKIRPRP